MGNHASCFFVGSSNAQTAKLFDSQGNLQRVKLPIKAAELMLEQPGHFIALVDELRLSRRMKAMRADDELLVGKIYVLVPSGRVNSKVSELEMAIIDLACKKRASTKQSGSKVLPAMMVEPKEEEEGEVQGFGGKVTGLPGCQLGNHRRWSPALEPISESF